ncbi:TPA: hypothetical protein ACLZFG_001736 [Streptococcus pneumoniae]
MQDVADVLYLIYRELGMKEFVKVIVRQNIPKKIILQNKKIIGEINLKLMNTTLRI